MKKIFSLICLLLALIPCMFVFTGCSLFESTPISVISVKKTSTEGLVDTYTITYSDGTTSSFTVTNGKDGEDGEDGIDGKDGEGTQGVSVTNIEKTSTEGLVDTYTITYSDGTTSNFTVTNGEKGEVGESATVEDIFSSAQANGFNGTFLEFLQAYLSINIDDSGISAISRAFLSSVSVYCNFVKEGNINYKSGGAGVIYQLDKENGNAYIITNYHVVYDNDSLASDHISDDISIYIYGYQEEISVTYVGGSMTYDIAILKITNSDIIRNSDVVAVEIANSDEIVPGQSAIAIGNPEAKGISVTSGVVSVDSESIIMTAVDKVTSLTLRVIRIDTPVNAGNSGGGLFNSKGQLIGIVNAKISDTSIENIGYAIPSNVVNNAAQKIVDECNGEIRKIKKVTLGITISSENSRAVYDSETSTTKIYEDANIYSIDENSIAFELGFQIGDLIKSIQINSEEAISIIRIYQIGDNILRLKSGDIMKFTIDRSGEEITINYTVEIADLHEIA